MNRYPLSAAAAASLLALALPLLGAAPKAPILEPGKLIILSTTDVKGHDDPCG